jgi:diadenosine tetraphosphate (Ap4A) HIT family hydrolase
MTNDFYCDEVLSSRTSVVMNLGNYQESKHLHWHIISGNPIR